GGAPEVDERLGAVFRPLSRGRLLMGLRLTVYGTAGSQGFSFLLLQFRDAKACRSCPGRIGTGNRNGRRPGGRRAARRGVQAAEPGPPPDGPAPHRLRD
ncbi:hypothetical protein CTI14_61075, partial [Methylobacterium radiotolerans]